MAYHLIAGQHHLLTAMVLHLRYPNAHTQWFISLLLHLFIDVKDDVFREVMTKVLLEKFVVHRPHPWGALVAFIELLRNPKYDFWSKEFVRIAPEVTLLLENVRVSSLCHTWSSPSVGCSIHLPTLDRFANLLSSQHLVFLGLFLSSTTLYCIINSPPFSSVEKVYHYCSPNPAGRNSGHMFPTPFRMPISHTVSKAE